MRAPGRYLYTRGVERPKIFFSSRMAVEPLQSLRADLHRRWEQGTGSAWVPELAHPEMKGIPLDEAEAACLQHIRGCQGFACVLDGSYGKDDWDITEISILEVEIFLAALSRLPIRIFLLEPFHPDPRIAGLLNIVEAACPGAVDRAPKSGDKVREAVLRFGDQITTPWRRALGRLVVALARRRSPAFRTGDLDVLFLEGRFAPPAWGRLDPDLVQQLVARADQTEGMPEKLVHLWKAVRCLAAAPYREAASRDYLPLWDRVLGRWASASSWYGLHGHLFLGRLAAVNALIDIRAQGVAAVDRELAIQGTHGAVASEYYSIAKRVPLWLWPARRRLFRQALESVDLALTLNQPDPSGLRGIRGSILLHLGAPAAAVRDYEKMHRLRVESGERLGEAEVELGMGYLWVRRVRDAEKLLESGVERLRKEPPSGFTVRALRKLSLFYTVTLRWQRSREVLAEAHGLATKLGLQDQIDQIRRMPGGRGWR